MDCDCPSYGNINIHNESECLRDGNISWGEDHHSVGKHLTVLGMLALQKMLAVLRMINFLGIAVRALYIPRIYTFFGHSITGADRPAGRQANQCFKRLHF